MTNLNLTANIDLAYHPAGNQHVLQQANVATNLAKRYALLCACFLAFFVIIFSASPAFADLRVCNRTDNPVSVAMGFRADKGWTSEGWWITSPGDCSTVFLGDLEKRYYYLYAVDDIEGGSWDGSVQMCTKNDIFIIFGVEDCLARGYERTGFFELDTGDNRSWTVQLTEDDQTSPDS